MVHWLIILAGAFGGGLLVLHGFNKCKTGGEQVLETYQQMLNKAAEGTEDRESAEANDSERDDQPDNEPTDEDR